MAAFGAARCQATVGRELEDDDEAVTVVPGDAEEAPAPATLVLLMASHIASADRLCALGDALRAASAAQTAAPDGILLSWSAEEAWRESARRLVKEHDCDAVECAGRRSQFEHLAALGALVAHRWGKARSVWCFFGDDDDLAHPSRTAEYRAVVADAPRRCASVCAMWRAEAARAAADAPPRPRSAADVEALLAAGAAERVRAAQESEIPNFKGSDLGHFPLVSADFWTSDHLSERYRSVDAFSGTRARGKLTLKRR